MRDWYASEDGLDLRALDADCAALQAAVAATEDALARQADQLSALSGAWQGPRRGGVARVPAPPRGSVRRGRGGFARRLRRWPTLRDSLWRTVDGKVAAALAIDDRRAAQRAEWLAAAQTVLRRARVIDRGGQ